MVEPTLNLRGVHIYKGYFDAFAQDQLLSDIRNIVATAPLFSPMTPYGKPMRVRMSSAGKFGWFSDDRGYRYVDQHPSGVLWPAIPKSILAVWQSLCLGTPEPECCLVNYYGEDAKMGMHQDKDEANFDWPVLSISLGDDALFRVGNNIRGGKTESVWLQSGDVAILSGKARLLYHGIDRVKHGTSQLLKNHGRINLTLRVVT